MSFPAPLASLREAANGRGRDVWGERPGVAAGRSFVVTLTPDPEGVKA
jgi:hypothetical protein